MPRTQILKKQLNQIKKVIQWFSSQDSYLQAREKITTKRQSARSFQCKGINFWKSNQQSFKKKKKETTKLGRILLRRKEKESRKASGLENHSNPSLRICLGQKRENRRVYETFIKNKKKSLWNRFLLTLLSIHFLPSKYTISTS